MKLTWKREMKHEVLVRERAEAVGMPEASIPRVYYGYEPNGKEHLHALVSRDMIGPEDWRWHISITAPGRVPDWNEIAAAGHDLRPGVCFVIGVPPRSWWLNLHPHVLHLYETKDANLVDQWRAEGRGDTPT